MHVWVGNAQCAKRQFIGPQDQSVVWRPPMRTMPNQLVPWNGRLHQPSELGATVPCAK